MESECDLFSDDEFLGWLGIGDQLCLHGVSFVGLDGFDGLDGLTFSRTSRYWGTFLDHRVLGKSSWIGRYPILPLIRATVS